MNKMLTTIIIASLLIVVIILGHIVLKQNKTIRLMDKCINYSDTLLDNNGIWDKDGSDYMSDYLLLRQELDSTFLSEFNKSY